ncbi:MAG: hypothetical protein BWY44_01195 [Candidatus Omnitrophica bacterium ADurb.Bin292]|nr:MAG: hypothetical protein BWY44_01195 [Candidatus Omnitrophica bacterium ADurb.Bin292]
MLQKCFFLCEHALKRGLLILKILDLADDVIDLRFQLFIFHFLDTETVKAEIEIRPDQVHRKLVAKAVITNRAKNIQGDIRHRHDQLSPCHGHGLFQSQMKLRFILRERARNQPRPKTELFRHTIHFVKCDLANIDPGRHRRSAAKYKLEALLIDGTSVVENAFAEFEIC